MAIFNFYVSSPEGTQKNRQKISQKSARNQGSPFQHLPSHEDAAACPERNDFGPPALGFQQEIGEFHRVSAAKLDGEPIEMVWSVGFDGGIWKPFFATQRFFFFRKKVCCGILLGLWTHGPTNNWIHGSTRDLYWFTIIHLKYLNQPCMSTYFN